jgi:hypothetical protein
MNRTLSGGNTAIFFNLPKKSFHLIFFSFSAKFFRSTAAEGDSQAAN